LKRNIGDLEIFTCKEKHINNLCAKQTITLQYSSGLHAGENHGGMCNEEKWAKFRVKVKW